MDEVPKYFDDAIEVRLNEVIEVLQRNLKIIERIYEHGAKQYPLAKVMGYREALDNIVEAYGRVYEKS